MAGIHRYECFRFRQEFDGGDSDWPLLSGFFPATRFLFRTHGPAYKPGAKQGRSGASNRSFESPGAQKTTWQDSGAPSVMLQTNPFNSKLH
jgi:hypothetical protein